MGIHPSAIVSNKAKLGKDVEVGPYAVIDENVVVGDNTKIGAHCVITGFTTIGKNCEIFSGAIVGSRPQDLKFKGEKSFLEIGDNNVIREYCTINPGTGDGGKTVIGSNNLLMAYVHIAHDCIVGNNCVFVNNATLGGHIVVEDHVHISGLSAGHQFVRFGKMSITGGCSKIVQDVPPFTTCDGHPAQIYGLNLIGLKRKNLNPESIRKLRKAYTILFNSGKPVKQAIEDLDAELLGNPEVEYLVNFIKNSPRGVLRSCRSKRRAEDESSDNT
jgi:UDP-N-acetylglucosamine acyltransferase